MFEKIDNPEEIIGLRSFIHLGLAALKIPIWANVPITLFTSSKTQDFILTQTIDGMVNSQKLKNKWLDEIVEFV